MASIFQTLICVSVCQPWESVGWTEEVLFFSGSGGSNNLNHAQAEKCCMDCGGILFEPRTVDDSNNEDQSDSENLVDYVQSKGGADDPAIWIGVETNHGSA